MRFTQLHQTPGRSPAIRAPLTVWLTPIIVLLSLLLGVVIVLAVPQHADAQNPCSGAQIFVAQVEADPWSDWDGDGISNIDEVNFGTPPCALPCNYLTFADIQLNPRGDWDGDGVDNLSEHQRGFNPCVYEQFNIVPSTNRPSAPVVVTATAVPAPPPPPTPAPAPTSTPAPPPPPTAVPRVTPTPLPTPTVASVPATPTGDGESGAEPSTLPLATSTPGPTATALEGDLAAARALLEDYDRAQEEAARATATPEPTVTSEPKPTATTEPVPSPEPSDDREVASDAPAVASSEGESDGPSSDASETTAPAETSGGVTIAVDQPCSAGVGFDGQCLKVLPMTLVVLSAGAVVGSMWWFDRRKNRPVQPSLELFD